jgi:hypothetical protein
LQTFTFETLLFFALFSIVSIRERRSFWASRPSSILTTALVADAAIGVLIGLLGLADMKPLVPGHVALVVAYAFVASLLVNDVIKTRLIDGNGSTIAVPA